MNSTNLPSAFGSKRFKSSVSGNPTHGTTIDHAVQLVGYGEEKGEKYWLVRNSWSASWGEAGYIRLSREDSQELMCGMDVTPQDGVACEGDTTPEKVCGTCGILYDTVYPTGAFLP